MDSREDWVWQRDLDQAREAAHEHAREADLSEPERAAFKAGVEFVYRHLTRAAYQDEE